MAAEGLIQPLWGSDEDTTTVNSQHRDEKAAKRGPLAGLVPMLEQARAGRYAVGAFNFCNAETAQAAVEQGMALRSPVLLMIGTWELPLLGAQLTADIVHSLASRADVPVCLHLDHAPDLDLVDECIKAGFSSVMFDGSRCDFEENVRLTTLAVEMAHAQGIAVEGELGAVGHVDESAVEGHHAPSLTDPDRAAEFVLRTGVDALAVAIGNAHGEYRQRPELDFERLEAIRRATDVPLVLHGGTGTPADQLERAIAIGVCKVNVATELSRGYLEAFARAAADPERGKWYAYALEPAKAETGRIVSRWMRQLGSAGRVP